jgi:predicted porin
MFNRHHVKTTAFAAALAAAGAAPQVALAASSVTITGYFKLSYEYLKISDYAGVGENSQDRVVDDRSRIYFRVVEDLGGGLQAIGQVDWRLTMDSGGDAANGNNYVGLRSKTWGTARIGRWELHYKYGRGKIDSKGSYKSRNDSLLAFAGGGGTAIAGASRTPNVIFYNLPDLNGFNLEVAYSANTGTSEADIGSTSRSGAAWNLRPYYKGKNFEIGYSYWKSEPDNPGAATVDQRGDRIWGHYKWNDFYFGLTWDRSELENSLGGARTSKRDAWSIPLAYQMGKHGFHLEYSEARDDKEIAGDNGAKMLAVGYNYSLSKRTSLALTYASIKNDEDAFYNLLGSASGQGSPDAAVAPGEDPSIIAFTVKHSF